MQGKKCETKGFGVLSLKCLIWLNKVGMIYNLNGSVKQSDYTPPPTSSLYLSGVVYQCFNEFYIT